MYVCVPRRRIVRLCWTLRLPVTAPACTKPWQQALWQALWRTRVQTPRMRRLATFYIWLPSTFGCLLHLAAFYIWLPSTFGYLLHLAAFYIWLPSTFGYLLHLVLALRKTQYRSIAHPWVLRFIFLDLIPTVNPDIKGNIWELCVVTLESRGSCVPTCPLWQ